MRLDRLAASGLKATQREGVCADPLKPHSAGGRSSPRRLRFTQDQGFEGPNTSSRWQDWAAQNTVAQQPGQEAPAKTDALRWKRNGTRIQAPVHAHTCGKPGTSLLLLRQFKVDVYGLRARERECNAPAWMPQPRLSPFSGSFGPDRTMEGLGDEVCPVALGLRDGPSPCLGFSRAQCR